MKKVITYFFVSVFSLVAFGQVEDFGEPKAWSGKLNKVKDFKKNALCR